MAKCTNCQTKEPRLKLVNVVEAVFLKTAPRKSLFFHSEKQGEVIATRRKRVTCSQRDRHPGSCCNFLRGPPGPLLETGSTARSGVTALWGHRTGPHRLCRSSGEQWSLSVTRTRITAARGRSGKRLEPWELSRDTFISQVSLSPNARPRQVILLLSASACSPLQWVRGAGSAFRGFSTGWMFCHQCLFPSYEKARGVSSEGQV